MWQITFYWWDFLKWANVNLNFKGIKLKEYKSILNIECTNLLEQSCSGWYGNVDIETDD